MIEAKKNKLFQKLFKIYHRQLLRSSFEQFYWLEEEKLPPTAIYIANHSSWWDGLVFFQLNQSVLPKELYVMMHESGIRKYPFFQKLGAFSVNRDSPKDIIKSLNYAQQLIQEGKSVGLFPQGDEYHLEKRPLSFQPGVTYLLEKCPDTPLIPLSFYYSFGHNRKPEFWGLAGKPIWLENLKGANRNEKTREIEKMTTQQLDVLKQMVIQEETRRFITLL
ncbi:lysophospholipid acyltransferase family protein [Cytobacillus spongiae]|jgi:1-acyl-sn-glycerol-3-phosphate acyltransferase|uniref:lysophospholipid acyltransferase family protein n=1 Tax=Cytobacillus spongiae TaxID=2901381 RepID=UPI001F1F9651|nr:lysophospholipid acyltransferase family protein [Cytobacillus spongiae]UII55489.1 lysophospholipid acyltransferase family protein [Cytobacillus spongiae]